MPNYNYKVKLHGIRAFAFDVDGVLTDGSILSTPDGDLGGVSQSIVHRFKGLGVKEEDIYQKSRDKVPDFLDFCSRHGLKPEEVAFAGDDMPDIPVLRMAGLAVAPADAVPEVKDVCDYVSLRPGGKAFVRDLIEQVLKVHEDWNLDTGVFAKTF